MEPTFGVRLQRWLAVRGISQAELGRRLNMSRATICGWVNDDTAPAMKGVPEVVAALGTTQAEFFGPLPDLPVKLVVKEAAPTGEAA